MSSRISFAVRQEVAARAQYLCEYCLISEEDSYFAHQVEHIISLKHGGSSDLENLALACVFCNRNKGSDIASVVPGTSEIVRFYSPRIDMWMNHFRLEGVSITSLTEIGEATVRILQMNHVDRILEREVLTLRGRYPGTSVLGE